VLGVLSETRDFGKFGVSDVLASALLGYGRWCTRYKSPCNGTRRIRECKGREMKYVDPVQSHTPGPLHSMHLQKHMRP
jgi:hypothetical protein